MKRIMRKNQVIITVLAVMIAIAGYLTYAGRVEVADSRDISMENTSDAKEAIAEYDTIDTAKEDATDAALTDIESLDQDIDDPGKMVLANGLTVSDYMAQTKLAREQTRGKNKEDLLAIIDSDAQTELDKQAAIDAVVRLTDYSDKENAVETLLSAKGFDHSIVSITQDAVDVVICKDNLTDAELAQIEDIVKRKTSVSASQICVTLMGTAKSVPNSGIPSAPNFVPPISSGLIPSAEVFWNSDITSLESSGISRGSIPVKSCNIRIIVGSRCPKISSFNRLWSILW